MRKSKVSLEECLEKEGVSDVRELWSRKEYTVMKRKGVAYTTSGVISHVFLYSQYHPLIANMFCLLPILSLVYGMNLIYHGIKGGKYYKKL